MARERGERGDRGGRKGRDDDREQSEIVDKLVAMGLIPEDQAMGARMMMGMFAVPSGEDELTSKIEFKEDGGVYANGQRIQ